MANLILARVTAKNGLFIGSVLHQSGELVRVDLDELGIPDLSKTQALVEVDEETLEPISTMAIASIAPRAPGADMPQGLPPGTVHSGTGRLLMPAGAGANAGAVEVRPDTGTAELTPEIPVRRDTDIEPVTSKVPLADTSESLVTGNTKAALLELATAEGVDGVGETNSKAEIADAIIAKRNPA